MSDGHFLQRHDELNALNAFSPGAARFQLTVALSTVPWR
jgi:hypothetical protein